MNKLSGIPPHTDHDEDAGSRVHFLKMLQTVTNKIHSTGNIDEIMLDLSQKIRELFAACDRLTIYVLEEKVKYVDRDSKVKTGLHSFKDFSTCRFPNQEHRRLWSALTKKAIVNIRNVYDEAELNAISPGLHYIKQDRSAHRLSLQADAGRAAGQCADPGIAGRAAADQQPHQRSLSKMVEEGLKELCETLAIAFAQRLKPPLVIRSKYHPLVAEAVLSLPELELAGRLARRKGRDIRMSSSTSFRSSCRISASRLPGSSACPTRASKRSGSGRPMRCKISRPNISSNTAGCCWKKGRASASS